MPKCGKVTLSGVTRLNDEQVLTDSDSVLLVDQELDNCAGGWCIDGDINLDVGFEVTNEDRGRMGIPCQSRWKRLPRQQRRFRRLPCSRP